MSHHSDSHDKIAVVDRPSGGYLSCMKLSRKLPLTVIIGLFLAVVLDTSLQLFWKSAVLALPAETQSWVSLLTVFREPLFIAVILVMCLQFTNWMTVLNQADLSFAQPIAALSYVSVGGLSAVLFHERLDPWQLVGIACVLAGVWFISRTDHSTHRTTDSEG